MPRTTRKRVSYEESSIDDQLHSEEVVESRGAGHHAVPYTRTTNDEIRWKTRERITGPQEATSTDTRANRHVHASSWSVAIAAMLKEDEEITVKKEETLTSDDEEVSFVSSRPCAPRVSNTSVPAVETHKEQQLKLQLRRIRLVQDALDLEMQLLGMQKRT